MLFCNGVLVNVRGCRSVLIAPGGKTRRFSFVWQPNGNRAAAMSMAIENRVNLAARKDFSDACRDDRPPRPDHCDSLGAQVASGAQSGEVNP